MGDTDRDKAGEKEAADSGLKVTDRRLFTADGDLRQELQEDQESKEEAAEASARSSGDASRPAAEENSGAGFEHRPLREPAGVDFTMLINAMAQPALLFLGEIAPPGAGERKIDLEQARIQIDMLELLKVKCRGNLSADEEGLLDRVLYQLRMLYVSRANQPQA